MINKNAIYKWDQWEKVNFARIKQEILNSPTLYSPDFGKDFLLYTFSSETSLVVVLTQKDDQGNMRPISFMSVVLWGYELNYSSINKQGYTVYNVVKHFRPYPLKSHIINFVPHPMVRSLFVQ